MKKQTAPQSQASDEKIVDMYWQRNPDAIQETDCKYGALLRNVAYNILFDNLDCEECQNDTYLRKWNSIPSARPAAFRAFIMQIMRRIAFDRYRAKSSKKRIPSQLTISIEDLRNSISHGASVEEAYDAKVIGSLITKFIKSLDDRQRYFFMDRYYMAEPVEKTAADLNVYFFKYTFEEVMALCDSMEWYTNASEKAHFYFKDTIPEGTEIPEDVQNDMK